MNQYLKSCLIKKTKNKEFKLNESYQQPTTEARWFDNYLVIVC